MNIKKKLKLVKIKSVERIPFRGYLYDATVNPCHNFFANGILVHNSEGTFGRRIQKGWREIPVRLENGKTVSINLQMEVATINGLSGHSDRNQLLSFVNRLSARPDKIIVVHGENQKALDLARTIHKLFRIETVAPKNLEGIRLK
jgi:predicted metal-dependent RNase